jgi:hypothetical protein
MVRVQQGRTAETHNIMSSEAKAKHYEHFLKGQQERIQFSSNNFSCMKVCALSNFKKAELNSTMPSV